MNGVAQTMLSIMTREENKRATNFDSVVSKTDDQLRSSSVDIFARFEIVS